MGPTKQVLNDLEGRRDSGNTQVIIWGTARAGGTAG